MVPKLFRLTNHGKGGLDLDGALAPRPVTVVVCDDHAVLTQCLAATLAAEPDIEVVGVAGTVADVLALADQRRPQVVLMDYELPDGDGVAATRALKDAHPETKVVMLTSYTDEAVLVRAIEAGCSGYLTKHEGSDEVATGVRLAAEGEALVSPDLLARLLSRLVRTQASGGPALTGRELEVLELVADGATRNVIAERLGLSPNTVRNHVQAILRKLGVHSKLEAVSTAVRWGLIRRR